MYMMDISYQPVRRPSVVRDCNADKIHRHRYHTKQLASILTIKLAS